MGTLAFGLVKFWLNMAMFREQLSGKRKINNIKFTRFLDQVLQAQLQWRRLSNNRMLPIQVILLRWPSLRPPYL
jgi:hypothetical protein